MHPREASLALFVLFAVACVPAWWSLRSVPSHTLPVNRISALLPVPGLPQVSLLLSSLLLWWALLPCLHKNQRFLEGLPLGTLFSVSLSLFSSAPSCMFLSCCGSLTAFTRTKDSGKDSLLALFSLSPSLFF